MIGTWVAHIPWLQDHLGISKATLGLCLLCMAAGRARLDAAHRPHPRPPPSASVTRAGDARLLPDAAAAAACDEPVSCSAAILFVFGASNGAMDVSMNAHGVALQRSARPADHVVAPRRLERRRLRRRRTGRSRRRRGVDPRVESLIVGVALVLAERSGSPGGSEPRPLTPRRTRARTPDARRAR